MALTKRQQLQRKVRSCIAAIERSESHLIDLRNEYGDEHPDHVAAIDLLLQLHETLVELLKTFIRAI